ncbi:MAG: alpha/beta hydrolase [bacterium]|nr:alpha/beta hydrolase [bacterium]
MNAELSSTEKSTTGRLNFVHSTVRPILGGLSRVAPGPASSLALRLFLTPPRHGSPMREIWWATEAESFEVSFGAGKLAAWRWGWSGPAVLLVHGWAGRGRQLGAFAAPLVEAGYQVVAYDAPGHGLSTGSRSSLPEMADAVTAMVRHLGGVAAIVAHSVGAAATTLAFGRPAGIRSLPSGETKPDVGRLVYVAPSVDMTSVTDRFGEMTGFSDEVVRRLRTGLEQRFAFRWPELQGFEVAPSMSRPLLVVHDRDDREVPHREGRALAGLWPNARLQSTRGLGHRRILRDDDVVAAVTEFIADTASRARAS